MSYPEVTSTRRAHASLAGAKSTTLLLGGRNSPILPTNSTLMPSCLTPLPSLTLTSTCSGSIMHPAGHRGRQRRRRVSRPHLASQSRRRADPLQSGSERGRTHLSFHGFAVQVDRTPLPPCERVSFRPFARVTLDFDKLAVLLVGEPHIDVDPAPEREERCHRDRGSAQVVWLRCRCRLAGNLRAIGDVDERSYFFHKRVLVCDQTISLTFELCIKREERPHARWCQEILLALIEFCRKSLSHPLSTAGRVPCIVQTSR
jgi:hypothetical protein